MTKQYVVLIHPDARELFDSEVKAGVHKDLPKKYEVVESEGVSPAFTDSGKFMLQDGRVVSRCGIRLTHEGKEYRNTKEDILHLLKSGVIKPDRKVVFKVSSSFQKKKKESASVSTGANRSPRIHLHATDASSTSGSPQVAAASVPAYAVWNHYNEGWGRPIASQESDRDSWLVPEFEPGLQPIYGVAPRRPAGSSQGHAVASAIEYTAESAPPAPAPRHAMEWTVVDEPWPGTLSSQGVCANTSSRRQQLNIELLRRALSTPLTPRANVNASQVEAAYQPPDSIDPPGVPS
jgi:hypothetical protein